jgi:hypothetical protein
VIELDRLTERLGALTAVDKLSFTVRAWAGDGLPRPCGVSKTTAIRIILAGLARVAARPRKWPMSAPTARCTVRATSPALMPSRSTSRAESLLAVRGDHRTVVTDNSAGMFAAASGDALLAKDDAVIAKTTYREWLAL